MTIGQRIEPRKIISNAIICMDCGTVTHGDMGMREAILALWERYGWNYVIGKRLCQLAIRYNRTLR